MKALAFALALFTSSVSLAYPALNDTANFTGHVMFQGQTYPMTLNLKLIQFNSSQNAFLQRTTSTVGGQSQTQDQWVFANEMFTNQQAITILSQCAQAGGKLETISVPAGRFNTCALPNDDQYEKSIYWIGDVPFGIVKASILNKEDGSHTTLDLQAYTGK